MWKNFIKEYLSFSRKERIGIYTLLTLIIIVSILPNFYKYFIHQRVYDSSAFDRELAQLTILEGDSTERNSFENGYRSNKYANRENFKTETESFIFDSNTATAEDWKRLGIRDKTVSTIQKYLAKGGHFYKPEDISKIWGFRTADVSRLIPLIRIENQKENQKQLFTKPEPKELKHETIIVGINLGNQININNVGLEELKSHPYIRYALPNAIIQYRNQHGLYSSVKDIQKIMIVNDSIYNKISPYLKIE